MAVINFIDYDEYKYKWDPLFISFYFERFFFFKIFELFLLDVWFLVQMSNVAIYLKYKNITCDTIYIEFAVIGVVGINTLTSKEVHNIYGSIEIAISGSNLEIKYRIAFNYNSQLLLY